MMNIFYVYYLRRPDKEDSLWPGASQPFYVGKGCNGRIGDHRWEAELLRHKPGRKTIKNLIIHKLWKQGLNFTEEKMFENLTEKEAHEIEIEAISVYGRIDLGTGCLANLTDGGEGTSGWIPSEETKRKIGDTKRGKESCLKGKHLTEAHREKIRQANLGEKSPQFGKTKTDEHRKKIGDSQRGEKSIHFGKHHSDERKK